MGAVQSKKQAEKRAEYNHCCIAGMEHASWRLVWGQILDGHGGQVKDTGVHSLDNRNSIKVFEMKNNMISAAHKKKKKD